jgi:hypothetical protein
LAYYTKINAIMKVSADLDTFVEEDFKASLAVSLSVAPDRIVITSVTSGSVSVSYFVRLDRDDPNMETIKKNMGNRTYLSSTTDYSVVETPVVEVVEDIILPVHSPPPPSSSSSDDPVSAIIWTVVGIILALLLVTVYIYMKQHFSEKSTMLPIVVTRLARMNPTQRSGPTSLTKGKVRAPSAKAGPSSTSLTKGKVRAPSAKAGPSSTSLTKGKVRAPSAKAGPSSTSLTKGKVRAPSAKAGPSSTSLTKGKVRAPSAKAGPSSASLTKGKGKQTMSMIELQERRLRV